MIGKPVKSGGLGKPNDNKAQEKGDFVLIYFFDSKESAKHYFPSGSHSRSDALKNGIAKHQSAFDNLFGKYFIQDKYYTEAYSMSLSAK